MYITADLLPICSHFNTQLQSTFSLNPIASTITKVQTFLCIVRKEGIQRELDGAEMQLSLSGNSSAYI